MQGFKWIHATNPINWCRDSKWFCAGTQMNRWKESNELVPGFKINLCRVSCASMQKITLICARTQRNRWKKSDESVPEFKINLCRGLNVSMQGIKWILAWIQYEFIQGLKCINARTLMTMCRNSNESVWGGMNLCKDSNGYLNDTFAGAVCMGESPKSLFIQK